MLVQTLLSQTLLSQTLAQSLGPNPGDVPALPPPPMLELWLFEEPVRIVLIVAALAAVAVLVLLRTGRRAPAFAVMGLAALLAGGAIAAGALVTTARERIAAQTTELVAATAEADSAEMTRLLDPNVSLSPGQYKLIPSIDGSPALIAAARQLPGRIDRIIVLETRVGLDGPRVARSQARVRAFGTGDQLLGHSWWGISWQEHDGAWRAVEIEPLWIQ